MHRFLSTVPFDLYELALFQLVVRHGSFTKAAALAGLTQSAITRQIQGIESSLEVPLLDRTTRTVRPTEAGKFLFQEATRLLGDVEQSLDYFAQEFAGARKEVRVAVSQSIGLAYLPAFFHANLRKLPNVNYRVSSQSSENILASLEANEQDIGVFCPPSRLPKTVRITHRFRDAFIVIAAKQFAGELQKLTKARERVAWLAKQNWLLIAEGSNTGRQMRSWLRRDGWRIEPTMQLDSFDLIINLVALGMGVSLVPIRALALYNQRQKLCRVPLPKKFTRELVVAVRKHRKTPAHIEKFIQNVLY